MWHESGHSVVMTRAIRRLATARSRAQRSNHVRFAKGVTRSLMMRPDAPSSPMVKAPAVRTPRRGRLGQPCIDAPDIALPAARESLIAVPSASLIG